MALIDSGNNGQWQINPRFPGPYHIENITYDEPRYSKQFREYMEARTWHICDPYGTNVLQSTDGSGAVFTTREVILELAAQFNIEV